MELNWDELLEECVDFASRLIQTPSMSEEEALVAELVAGEMQQLGFDRVWLDEIGNVFGLLNGRDRSLPAIVLNSHLDHVDPGDPALWPVPPYSGAIVDGRIYGRGACDIKGPLAVQVYSMAALRRGGQSPRRDVLFSGVVQEETGGAGARHMVEHLDTPVSLVLLGEPSDNDLALGHRGILQMWLTFRGRSVHASAPGRGVNPNYALAGFLFALQAKQPELSRHPILGETSIAPTLVEVDTTSANVTPAWTRVLLDVRTSSESVNSLLALVDDLAAAWPHEITSAWSPSGVAAVPPSAKTLTGFYTPPDSPVVRDARAAIEAGTGRQPQLTAYIFATDGRFFARQGIPVLGYSPGEEPLAHTVHESISIEKMAESLRGHARLLRDF